MNLHHFLYRWASAELEESERRGPRVELDPVDQTIESRLRPAEARHWREAVRFYGQNFAGRSLLFDKGLVAIRNVLAEKTLRTRVPEPDRSVFAHLERCAPIYRRHWWPRHDQANRAWIDDLKPLLERHERAVARRITTTLETRWPSPPNRVDVSAYASWSSAYSTSEPHATIASLSPANAEPLSLEVVFHEHCHSAALEGRLREIVDAAFARHGHAAPRNLWHILLFALAGESTRLTRVAAGEPSYETYAQREGVFSRRPLDRHAWAAIDAHLIPALGRGEPLTRVIDDLVKALEPHLLESSR